MDDASAILANVTLRARVWVEIALTMAGMVTRLASPSVRGCGLKSRRKPGWGSLPNVTLRARVWVEIMGLSPGSGSRLSHPPCEGVG